MLRKKCWTWSERIDFETVVLACMDRKSQNMDHSKEFTWLQCVSLARFAISIPKEKYDMRKKQRGMILFFSNLSYFLGVSLLASEIFTLGKILQLSADYHERCPLCNRLKSDVSQTSYLPPTSDMRLTYSNGPLGKHVLLQRVQKVKSVGWFLSMLFISFPGNYDWQLTFSECIVIFLCNPIGQLFV